LHEFQAYPIKFEPLYKEKIWGGRRLADVLGKALPDGKKIGESWEVSQHAHGTSVVANGAYRGETLAEMVARFPAEVMGSTGIKRADGRFPLLFKFLDASDILSVQVHPDDAYAVAAGDLGKTECWYVVDALPGSRITKGLKPGVTPDEFERRALAGTVGECLNSFPVAGGEVIFIPAGTVHAIGAGCLVAEIQQNSDTTYRVFDWNRLGADGKPRDLHVKDALAVIDFDRRLPNTETPEVICELPFVRESLVACDKFILESAVISKSGGLDEASDSFTMLVVLEGEGALHYGPGLDGSLPVRKGETLLLPAALGRWRVETDATVKMLRVRLPA